MQNLHLSSLSSKKLTNTGDIPRIAWLLPSAFFYWQPPISHFTKMFPLTRVFTGSWPGFSPGFEDSFEVEVFERKIIPLTRNATSYGDNFTYLSFKIINQLLRFKPDIIFSSSFGIWTILALLLKLIGKWRVIIAYEGSSPGVDYRRSAARLFLRRAMVRAADACITNSRAGKAYLIEVLKAQESRVFVYPYEVPAAESLIKQSLATNLNTESMQRPIFLFVGGIIPRKGLHLLLEACANLQQQGYSNYTLLVVGDGAQKQELEAFSNDRGLTDCVRWVGRVDYGNLGSYFGKADVFVLPTLEDTWGVVVLEAMVLGKPILCSQCAGASEMVVHEENGYLFDPHQPEELAALMRRFIDNPDLITAMGNKSEQLMNQHTPEKAAEFFAQVTSFVLGNLEPLQEGVV